MPSNEYRVKEDVCYVAALSIDTAGAQIETFDTPQEAYDAVGQDYEYEVFEYEVFEISSVTKIRTVEPPYSPR